MDYLRSIRLVNNRVVSGNLVSVVCLGEERKLEHDCGGCWWFFFCGNWSGVSGGLWGGGGEGGRGGHSGTGMNWRVLVRRIRGQGPRLDPQTKSLFCPFERSNKNMSASINTSRPNERGRGRASACSQAYGRAGLLMNLIIVSLFYAPHDECKQSDGRAVNRWQSSLRISQFVCSSSTKYVKNSMNVLDFPKQAQQVSLNISELIFFFPSQQILLKLMWFFSLLLCFRTRSRIDSCCRDARCNNTVSCCW